MTLSSLGCSVHQGYKAFCVPTQDTAMSWTLEAVFRDTIEEFSAATQSLNPAETLQPVRDLWSTMRLNWYRSDGIEWYRRR